MVSYHAVVWTRVTGKPQKIGDLILRGDRCELTYRSDYSASGLSLLGDQSQWGREPVSYPVSERVPVLPPLLNHIPGRNLRNLQRSVYLNILRDRLGHEPPPGIETEWQMLQLGGHGGIGHLDVFSDDIHAQAWYAEEKSRPVTALYGSSGLWNLVKRNIRDQSIQIDTEALMVLGPTPSVGGMIPKLLVSMESGEDNVFYPPDAPGKQNRILKIEAPEYRGLMDLETLCLDLHREAGFETPAHRLIEFEGIPMLAVERFDRTPDGRPIPTEALFSVMAMGDHQIRENADLQLEELGTRLGKLRRLVPLPRDTEDLIYQRILFALLTGNGDLHLNNLSFLGDIHGARLAPVYDPAPMRAWPRHNLRSAIPFDPAGPTPFVNIGRSLGLTHQGVGERIRMTLLATEGFTDRVAALDKVPADQRDHLIQVVQTERHRLEAELGKAFPRRSGAGLRP